MVGSWRKGVETSTHPTTMATGKIDCSAQSDSTSNVRLRRKTGALLSVYRAVSAVSPSRFSAVCLSLARNRLAPSNFGKVSRVFGIGRARFVREDAVSE